ncbi:MAG: HD domain-containing protein [Planctomycetota bacterium]
MIRRFVNELTDGESVDQIFIASEKQLRPNRNGDLYLQLRVNDKTGSVTTMLWNADQKKYDSFENGDYVRVQGTAQLYNGKMQILARGVEKNSGENVDEDDFITLSAKRVDGMILRVGELLRSSSCEHLRNLAECFLTDEEFIRKFRLAPAGIKNHHAYQGGLLEHVLNLMELVEVSAPRYEFVDADLLMMGAFLHDIGKIEELTYEPDLGYSTSGQLIGHLVQGVQVLDGMIARSESLSGEPFPDEIANRLRHMIVSHHGSHEFGSPKLPMTLEAIMLHHLDNLDAKMHSVKQLIEEDANTGSPWTVFNPPLQRKIYKGS